MRSGEALVIFVGSVLLAVVGGKVFGWWFPTIVVLSYVVGTYLNHRELR